MDIKQLKFSMKLAETRAKSDPSEANIAILKAATDAYEFALDPEKKTEDEADHKPEPEAPKPASAPKPAAPKAAAPKATTPKAATAPKVEATPAAGAPVATQPVRPEQPAPQSQEQQTVSEAQPEQETATTAASDPA